MNHALNLLCRLSVLGVLFLCSHVAMAATEAGVIDYMRGDVQLWHGNTAVTAELKAVVFEGDKIVTGEASRVRIVLVDGSTMQMGEKAESVLQHYSHNKEGFLDAMVELVQGRARFIVNKLRNTKSNYQVKMRAVLIGVRGTDILAQVGATDHVALVEGRVQLSDKLGGLLMLGKDHYVRTTSQLPAATTAIPVSWLTDFINDVGTSSAGKKAKQADGDDGAQAPSDAIRQQSSRALGTPTLIPK